MHLATWEKFEEIASGIHARNLLKPPLYRGQRCGDWGLKTTLERHGFEGYFVQRYIADMQKAALAVETATGKWACLEKMDGGLGGFIDVWLV